VTITQQYSLRDAIDEALRKTNDGTTQEVIRYLRKHHRNVLNDAKIQKLFFDFFDFGLDHMEMDDATIDDLDKHILLREVQQQAHAAQTQCLLRLRQAAARVVPGRTDIPMRELTRIVKAQRGE
jgi:cell fate (sporulation/competence/biofilm development) regulator YlbF (YheA/YmcA/DUF963 family)